MIAISSAKASGFLGPDIRPSPRFRQAIGTDAGSKGGRAPSAGPPRAADGRARAASSPACPPDASIYHDPDDRAKGGSRRGRGPRPGLGLQSTPAVISARAARRASISASVVNGPGLTRSVPSGKVPMALWM